MNNSINSNLSFKANLVTTLKGKNNIMQPIAEEFAKITKKASGEFVIERAEEVASAHLKKFQYKDAFVISTAMNAEFAKDPEKIGQRGVKVIARKLADIFYSLKAEDAYKEKISSSAESIVDLKIKIRELSKLKANSEKYGMDFLAEKYAKAINAHKKEIGVIEEKVKASQSSFLSQLEKYPDNKVVKLQRELAVDYFENELPFALKLAALARK